MSGLNNITNKLMLVEYNFITKGDWEYNCYLFKIKDRDCMACDIDIYNAEISEDVVMNFNGMYSDCIYKTKSGKVIIKSIEFA